MKRFFAILLIFCSFLVMANANGAEKTSPKGPEIYVLEPDYKFQTVLDGSKITHDFIVQNLGDEVLKIEKVKTTWGCTAASYTKLIPPGGEGKITIVAKTEGLGGKTLEKRITVSTNDARNPKRYLTVSGNVDKR